MRITVSSSSFVLILVTLNLSRNNIILWWTIHTYFYTTSITNINTKSEELTQKHKEKMTNAYCNGYYFWRTKITNLC